jgi:hypothetical protein
MPQETTILKVNNAPVAALMHHFVRAFSRTRTQHRGTRTRIDAVWQSDLLVRKFPQTASINDRHRCSSNSHRVRVPLH